MVQTVGKKKCKAGLRLQTWSEEPTRSYAITLALLCFFFFLFSLTSRINNISLRLSALNLKASDRTLHHRTAAKGPRVDAGGPTEKDQTGNAKRNKQEGGQTDKQNTGYREKDTGTAASGKAKGKKQNPSLLSIYRREQR